MNPAASPVEMRRLHAQARGWAAVLKLPFRQQRWRGQAGGFSGTGTGGSQDFQDHRAYLPGDDPRQINWQAYARTGNYSMKLYREEVRPALDVVLDASASMFAFPAKRQRVLELLAYAVEAALEAGAALRCYAVSGTAHCLLETESILTGRWADKASTLPQTTAFPALARLPLRPGAMRLWISDLLFPGEPDPALAPLSQKQGRGMILCPFAEEEAVPGWEGNYEFEDPEAGSLHGHRITAPLLTRYQEAYARHFQLWRNAANRHGVLLARVPAEDGFLPALRTEALARGLVESAWS